MKPETLQQIEHFILHGIGPVMVFIAICTLLIVIVYCWIITGKRRKDQALKAEHRFYEHDYFPAVERDDYNIYGHDSIS